MAPQSEAALAVAVAVGVVAIGAYAFARSSSGRRVGRRIGPLTDVVVRCRSGHLFTTTWIPGASFKAIRLGPLRFQHCPVGRHWTLVTPVARSRLSDAERRVAETTHDAWVP